MGQLVARDLNPYRLTLFTGENDQDGLEDQEVFGRQRGAKLYRARGVHQIGRGRLLTRRGYTPLLTSAVNGAAAMQGLYFHETAGNRYLVAVAGGKVKYTTGALGSWTDYTSGITLTAGQDVLHRFCTYQDSNSLYVIGTDGVNRPYALVPGTSTCVTLPGAGNVPALAADIQEFHGYLLVLGPEGDPTLLEASQYGQLAWTDPIIIQTTKNSRGLALARPNRDALLAFYEDQIWRVQFNNTGSSALTAYPVEGSEPAVSRTSICTSRGYTYYAGNNGPYRIGSPRQPAQYIGHDIEQFWDECNKNRRKYISTFKRGFPWSEVVFCVSYGTSTVHNAYLLWNEDRESFTIIPPAVVAGTLEFNCGTNWRDTNNVDHTIMGGYTGVAYKAWGAANSDSTYYDNGQDIKWELQSGLLNYGYDGVKSQRFVWVDYEAADQHTIDVELETIGSDVTVRKSFVLGTVGDLLDVNFTLDESYLQAGRVAYTQKKIEARSRFFQWKFSETGHGVPLIFTNFTFPHVRLGVGLK